MLTVGDLLNIAYLKECKIIAGHQGLDNPVYWLCRLESDELDNYSFHGDEFVFTTGKCFADNEDFLRYIRILIENKAAGLVYDRSVHSLNINEETIDYLNRYNFPLITSDNVLTIKEIIGDINALLASGNEENLNEDYYRSLIQMDGKGKYLSFDADNFLAQVSDYIKFTAHYLNIDICYWHILSAPIYSAENCIPVNTILTEDVLKQIDSISDFGIYFGDGFLVGKITYLYERYAYIVFYTSANDKYILYVLERLTAFLRSRVINVFVNRLQKKHTVDADWAKAWLMGNMSEFSVLERLKHYGIDAKPEILFVCVVKLPVSKKTSLKNGSSNEDAYQAMNNFALKCSILLFRIFKKYGFKTIEMVDNDFLKYIVMAPSGMKLWPELLDKALRGILEREDFFNEFQGTGVAVGKLVEGIAELHISHDSAMFADNLLSSRRLIKYDDLYALRILEHLYQDNLLDDYIYDHLRLLLSEENVILLKTLKVYYECNCSKQKTAEQLYIARQTLYSRLKKIEMLIGDEFDKGNKRLGLELAIAGLAFLKSKK